MKLNNEALILVKGGAIINATFFNSIARLASTIIEIGKMLGASIRKLVAKN